VKHYPVPHGLMSALSRDLAGGARFSAFLHKKELPTAVRADLDAPGAVVLDLERKFAQLVALQGVLLLNPAHALMREGTRLAALRGSAGRRSVLLGPVGTGTTWFDEHVWGRSDLYFLRPRILFDGFRAGHRSDFFAAVYPPPSGAGQAHLYDWKTGERRGYLPLWAEVR
jgi:hypothetical protein